MERMGKGDREGAGNARSWTEEDTRGFIKIRAAAYAWTYPQPRHRKRTGLLLMRQRLATGFRHPVQKAVGLYDPGFGEGHADRRSFSTGGDKRPAPINADTRS